MSLSASHIVGAKQCVSVCLLQLQKTMCQQQSKQLFIKKASVEPLQISLTELQKEGVPQNCYTEGTLKPRTRGFLPHGLWHTYSWLGSQRSSWEESPVFCCTCVLVLTWIPRSLEISCLCNSHSHIPMFLDAQRNPHIVQVMIWQFYRGLEIPTKSQGMLVFGFQTSQAKTARPDSLGIIAGLQTLYTRVLPLRKPWSKMTHHGGWVMVAPCNQTGSVERGLDVKLRLTVFQEQKVNF